MVIYIVKKYTKIFAEITKLVKTLVRWPVKERKKTIFR